MLTITGSGTLVWPLIRTNSAVRPVSKNYSRTHTSLDNTQINTEVFGLVD